MKTELREKIEKILGKFFPDEMDAQMYHPNQPLAVDALVKTIEQDRKEFARELLALCQEQSFSSGNPSYLEFPTKMADLIKEKAGLE